MQDERQEGEKGYPKCHFLAPPLSRGPGRCFMLGEKKEQEADLAELRILFYIFMTPCFTPLII